MPKFTLFRIIPFLTGIAIAVVPSTGNEACIDSTARFKYTDDFFQILKTECSDISEESDDDIDIMCGRFGVSVTCAETCDDCTCADSELVFRAEWNGERKFRDCDWAASSSTTEKCAIEEVSSTCKATCGTCTVAPSSVPSSAPSECIESIDSSARFKYTEANSDVIIKTFCSDISELSDDEINDLCGLFGVSGTCAETCNACTCSDSELVFRAEWAGETKFRGCDWAASSSTAEKCDIEEVSSTCKATCGTCPVPSLAPTSAPTLAPTSAPSLAPTSAPSLTPTSAPSSVPSSAPSLVPSSVPTSAPSKVFSTAPSTTPSSKPSASPSSKPSASPSSEPSSAPSSVPSSTPSSHPSTMPSVLPSITPSVTPSTTPSVTPSVTPSTKPSITPTSAPSAAPSSEPSSAPSSVPSSTPSSHPSAMPSMTPSITPSVTPSTNPSMTPTSVPTTMPSVTPSVMPSVTPSMVPSSSPTPLQCIDSELRFRTEDANGDTLKEYCRNISPDQCDLAGVSGHCRLTCSACGCYDSTILFKVDQGFRDCDWIKDDAEERCAEDGVKESCLLTCSGCASPIA